MGRFSGRRCCYQICDAVRKIKIVDQKTYFLFYYGILVKFNPLLHGVIFIFIQNACLQLKKRIEH